MEYREVEVENGVVAFDGNVLEAFGFSAGGSQRIPVSQIKAIEDQGGTVTIRCHGSNPVLISLSLGGDDTANEQLKELLELVRGNALNLEDG